MKSENKCSLLRKFSSYSDGGCYAKIIFLEGRAPSSLWGGGILVGLLMCVALVSCVIWNTFRQQSAVTVNGVSQSGV